MQTPRLEKIKPESFGDFDRVLDEFLPYLNLNSDQVIDIANWENGKKYKMMIEIRQDGSSLDKVTGVVSSNFKVTAYKVLKEKNIDEMDDKEFEEYQGDQLTKMSTLRGSSPSNNLETR